MLAFNLILLIYIVSQLQFEVLFYGSYYKIKN